MAVLAVCKELTLIIMSFAIDTDAQLNALNGVGFSIALIGLAGYKWHKHKQQHANDIRYTRVPLDQFGLDEDDYTPDPETQRKEWIARSRRQRELWKQEEMERKSRREREAQQRKI